MGQPCVMGCCEKEKLRACLGRWQLLLQWQELNQGSDNRPNPLGGVAWASRSQPPAIPTSGIHICVTGWGLWLA